MKNPDYVERLNKVFGNVSMAEVARRLEVPHATVQIRLALEQLVARAFARRRQEALHDEVRRRRDADFRMREEDLRRAPDGQAPFEHERPERCRPLEPRLPWVECHCSRLWAHSPCRHNPTPV